ncbi:MAG: amidohydrolase family protein [Bacteroidota bacterium]
MNRVICFCASIALAMAASAQPIAIVDVALVPLDSARVIPHQTVILNGDRIVAIGPNPAVDVPADAYIVDGSGRFLMPGLADMHAHFSHPETMYYAENNQASAALLLAYGVTTARVMWGTPGVLAFADSVREGHIPGPRVTVASPFLQSRADTAGPWDPREAGDPAVWRVRTEADGRAAARHAYATGYDYIKAYNEIPMEAYEGVLAESEALGVPVVGHVPRAVGLAGVLADGRQRSLEHLDVFRSLAERSDSPARDSTQWYHRYFGSFDYADPERLDVLAALVAAEGTWVVPTALTAEWYGGPQPDMLARLASPDVVRYTAPGQRELWRRYAEGFALNYAQWGLDMTANRSFALLTLAALHRRGVNLMVGTDATPAMSPQGLAVHEEMALWAEAGIPPLGILRAATLAPARYLREFGLEEGPAGLSVGAVADLVLLTENPLIDVAHARRIDAVVARGHLFHREALDALLTRVEQRYANTP